MYADLLLNIGTSFAAGRPRVSVATSSDTCVCVVVSRAVPLAEIRAFSAEQGVAFAATTTHYELYVERR